MATSFTGPVAAEIDKRLRDALAPTRLEVINDSDKHRGHAGHDGSGVRPLFQSAVLAARFRGSLLGVKKFAIE